MKKIFNIVLSLAFVAIGYFNANGQAHRYFDERYISTHAYLNPILYNAGATAFHQGHELLVNYRNKWSTFDGAPKTITLGYDGVLMDRLGIGAMFLQDNFGALRTTKGQLSLAYLIPGDKNSLSFGLSTEYIQHGLNNNVSSDEIFDPNDPVYRLKNEGASFLDVSFGLYGKYMNQFTYGIALPSLISSRIDDDADNDRELGFIVNLGYQLKSISGISVEPSIIVKKLNNVPTHVDLNAKLGFLDDKFTSGISYTLGADKRLGFLIGFRIDKVNVFYSYNTSMHDFQDYNNGSHEVSVKLTLGAKKKEMPAVEEDKMMGEKM